MPTQDDILSKVQQRNQARMDAVESLIAAAGPIAEARAALEKAERAYARQYSDALKVWTEDELKAVGVEAPAKNAPGRPRKKSAQPAGGQVPQGQGVAGTQGATDWQIDDPVTRAEIAKRDAALVA